MYLYNIEFDAVDRRTLQSKFIQQTFKAKKEKKRKKGKKTFQ